MIASSYLQLHPPRLRTELRIKIEIVQPCQETTLVEALTPSIARSALYRQVLALLGLEAIGGWRERG